MANSFHVSGIIHYAFIELFSSFIFIRKSRFSYFTQHLSFWVSDLRAFMEVGEG